MRFRDEGKIPVCLEGTWVCTRRHEKDYILLEGNIARYT
jgi:hypothetical protein